MKPSEAPARPVMDVRGPATRPAVPVVARSVASNSATPTPVVTPPAKPVAPEPSPVAPAKEDGVPVKQSPMALRQPPVEPDDEQEGQAGEHEETAPESPKPEVQKIKKTPNVLIIPIALTVVAMIFISSLAIYMYLQS
ncbi:MAG TPA: hypothetical protein VFI74_02250 [Candidatus Saccharimonadales bacterium]|nr:hypothetical protein [Candidatus Saccharimonadales bacterium]